jgi:valyl-tRNA synthetase
METGHDILFFWVARMAMLSYGMTGKLPFKTVFLHGLVRDEKGRKMSKSLGNVVDPLNVIEDQGCDALRFTLATGTAAGQDLNLNMDRLASNRNFTNKIWNAGKFVLFSLSGMADDDKLKLVEEAEAIGTMDEEAIRTTLPLPSAWIVGKLRSTTDHVTAAHDRFDFGEAGRAAYAFFYDDFADWFIEASKARLYGDDETEKRLTQAVSLHVLDQTLRLLHPFVPYVTEEVWRSTPHRGETLMLQKWPTLNAPVDSASITRFELLQSIVRSIRNARQEYAVEPARRVPATIVVADDADRDALAKELAVVASLARLDLDSETCVSSTPPAEALENPASFVQQVVADGVEVYLPLAGIVDPAKESARLEKQAAKLEKEIGGLAGRLSSPKFVEKAPEEVVRKSEAELAELRERLAAVAARLEQMKALAAA